MKSILSEIILWPFILVEGITYYTKAIVNSLKGMLQGRYLDLTWFVLVIVCIALTSAPWIQYSTDFAESEQNLITSKAWPIFAFSGTACLLLYFVPWKIRSILYWLAAISIAALWVYGYINPQAVHTDISLKSDFSFYYWIYIYILVHSISFLISFSVFSSNPVDYGSLHRLMSDSEQS